MILQYAIIIAALLLAMLSLVKKLVAPFKKGSCASDCGCATADLKKSMKSQQG